MGLMIILAVLLLASIALFIYGKKDEWDRENCLIAGVVGMIFIGGTFLVLVGVLCVKPAQFAWNEQQYYNLKAQVEYVDFAAEAVLTGDNMGGSTTSVNEENPFG